MALVVVISSVLFLMHYTHLRNKILCNNKRALAMYSSTRLHDEPSEIVLTVRYMRQMCWVVGSIAVCSQFHNIAFK